MLTMAHLIEEIRSYTSKHPELTAAHHFLFDLRLSSEAIDYIVMGINPGETAEDWALLAGPTEETSQFDFHTNNGRGKSSAAWLRNIQFFLNSDRVVIGEYFFWSSGNAKEKFIERFGELLRSPHLNFCRDMNKRLVDHYRPRAVISPGIGMAGPMAELYGLKTVTTIKADNGNDLVRHYSDGVRPWLFTKHWTGAFGFSNGQRGQVRDYIAQRA